MSTANKLESFWYKKSTLAFLLLPLSWLIQLIAITKKYLYQTNILFSEKLPVPVILVGNITVGGTGKTPFICALTNELAKKNIQVGIISRGYKSSVESDVYLVTENDNATKVGDEAYLLYQRLQVPIAIGANRVEAAKLLLKNNNVDVIISDDGLQHYKLARDFEFLMVDGSRYFGNRLMLPFGPLREPVSRLNSVDQIIINSKSIELNHRTNLPNAINISVKPQALIHIVSGEQVSLINLTESKFIAVAGIGNPQRFFNSLKSLGGTFESKVFDDHYNFSELDFADFSSEMIVMTEKDATKCKSFAQDNWYYLLVDMEIGENVLDSINQKLNLF